MKEDLFYSWLNTRYTVATSRARFTNCRAIEREEGDL